MGGDSGAEVSLVRRVSVLNQVPRARARFRRGYGSAGGNQVRSGQVWGFVCGDLSGAVGECSGVVCRVAGGRVGPPYGWGWGDECGLYGCAGTSCCLWQSRILSGTTQGL